MATRTTRAHREEFHRESVGLFAAICVNDPSISRRDKSILLDVRLVGIMCGTPLFLKDEQRTYDHGQVGSLTVRLRVFYGIVLVS